MNALVNRQALLGATDTPKNTELPMVMHIDLNSCFAIIEQQANRLLRGRPVGVAAYDTPKGFVLAASYEAKAKGVKLGVNVQQAKAMCPGMVIMTPDPAKYRKAHKLFKELMLEYTPDVEPKSIDEFVLNMNNSPTLKKKIRDLQNTAPEKMTDQKMTALISGRSKDHSLHNRAMIEVGLDMKQKIKERLGQWVTVNVGIGLNRFLAKYGAGFDKPDGMTIIDHINLKDYYRCKTPHKCKTVDDICGKCGGMKLVDLPGINVRYRARLRVAGIYTPLDFYNADLNMLKKQVFKSINGFYWYQRLHGYEIDDVRFERRRIGHQHAISSKTSDINELSQLLMKLSEKTGRRLRSNDLYATGVHLYIGFISDNPGDDMPASFEHMYKMKSWHKGRKTGARLYSTQDIYEAAKKLLHEAEMTNKVKILALHVYDLHDWDPQQLSIFDTSKAIEKSKLSRIDSLPTDLRSVNARKYVSDAVDSINNRYGEFVITPALMLEMQGTILDRIAFGQVRDV